MAVRIRPFEDRDYERLAELSARIDAHSPLTAEILRYRDRTVEPRVRLLRLAADADAEGVVAFGRIMHIWWAYHPRHFQMRIEVEPRWRQQGIGSALFERLLAELRAWDAELVRAEARASLPEAVAFLEHRGFREWRRRWESVLDVATANVAPLLEADRRVAAQGITITTYAAELARRGERLARDAYAAEALIGGDEPANAHDAAEPMSFERFVVSELEAPGALHDARFLALHEDQIVGLSNLSRDLRHPDVLGQSFTGTHPAYRGRGIAQALKLRTIEYARQHGYRRIRTSNDSTNAPMLHINDTLGFQRQLPTIIFERRLGAG